MLDPKKRYDLINMLNYFWKEKSDITRLSGFDLKVLQYE
jgi:hypothetical protein